MFSKVLVAIDGSDHAHQALEVGSDIADRYDAEMLLVHVLDESQASSEIREMVETEHVVTPPQYRDMFQTLVEYPPLAGSEHDTKREAYLREIFVAAGKAIVERGKRQSHEKGVKAVHTTVLDGDPAKEILACATRNKVDLVVMGSRGLGTLKKLVLGSVSRKVSENAECSCLTVKL